MKWPDRVQVILNTLAAQHPTWVSDDGGPAPTPRYRLNEMFAQQVRFEMGDGYGLKSADAGRPVSSETLAYRTQNGDTIIGWSWENKHDGTVDQFPESEDISMQVFHDVQPVDHLGGAVPLPSPPVPSSPTPSSVGVPPYAGDQFGTAMGAALFSDYEAAGQAPNHGMGVWFSRVDYDYMVNYVGGMEAGEAMRQSIAKHRNEWRSILGLPAV